MLQRSEPSTPVLALAFAAATGLALGALDALVDLSVRSSVSASPLSTWTVFGTSALAGALAYVVLRLALAPLLRRVPADRGAAGLALAAAVITLALPTLLACYRALEPQVSSTLAAAAAAPLVALGVFLLARPFGSRPGGAAAVALFAAWLAICAVLACAFVALRKEAILWGATQSLAGLAAVLVLAALLGWLARRASSLAPAAALLAVLLAGALGLALAHAKPEIRAPAGKGAVAAGKTPRHVILIVVDTLRGDFLSCDSPAAPQTPALDGLAAESVRFSHARSAAPWTFPSMSSILSGLAPGVHLGLRPFDALPDQVTTLATRFSDAGFLTAAFVRNPALRAYTHIDRGFDEYHFQREPHPPSALAEVLLRPCLPDIYVPQVGAEIQTRRAAAWIAEHKDRDFFLWVHYFDPHMAYNPPREFQPEGSPPASIGRNFADAARVRGGFLNPDAQERDWIRKLYAGEVRATDRGIAGLLEALKREGVFDGASIVFTADHGDELWEHDGFEHGHALYDEVLGVPLFVKLPGSALKQRVDEPVSNASVAPTLLELGGVPYDPAQLSVPPLLRRDPEAGGLRLDVIPRPLVSTGILYFEGRRAVVFEGFKYIRFDVSEREELYDLAADPGEHRNLAAERPELAQRGRGLLEAEAQASDRLREQLGIRARSTNQLDADTARDMQALGYVK